jgi:hypothetical protein
VINGAAESNIASGVVDFGCNRSAVMGASFTQLFHASDDAGKAPRKSIVYVESTDGGGGTPISFTAIPRCRSTAAARESEALFLDIMNENEEFHGAADARTNVPGDTVIASVLRRVNEPKSSC